MGDMSVMGCPMRFSTLVPTGSSSFQFDFPSPSPLEPDVQIAEPSSLYDVFCLQFTQTPSIPVRQSDMLSNPSVRSVCM